MKITEEIPVVAHTDAPEPPRSHYREVFANGLLTATAKTNRLFLKEKLMMLIIYQAVRRLSSPLWRRMAK